MQKIALGIALVALIVSGVAISLKDSGDTLAGTTEFQKKSFVEGFFAGNSRQINVSNTGALTSESSASFGDLIYTEENEAITDDDTVTVSQSGTTFYISGAEATSTLPAVASSAGVVVRYVVAGALSGDFHIDSAEGDNIEGSAIVAGAVVDCDAEDQLNFVSDGENLGDFVELRSDGSKWFLTQSNVLTAAKLTCTDPT